MSVSFLSEEEVKQLINKGERFYAPIEIAHILQIKQATAQEYCRTGKIRAIKINGMWHTTKDEITRFVLEGPYKSPEEGNDNRQCT